jgi:hypothetical protein
MSKVHLKRERRWQQVQERNLQKRRKEKKDYEEKR